MPGTFPFCKLQKNVLLHCELFLDDSATSENTNTQEIPKETPNGQDTSCYQLSNGGQIHDVRNTGIALTVQSTL